MTRHQQGTELGRVGDEDGRCDPSAGGLSGQRRGVDARTSNGVLVEQYRARVGARGGEQRRDLLLHQGDTRLEIDERVAQEAIDEDLTRHVGYGHTVVLRRFLEIVDDRAARIVELIADLGCVVEQRSLTAQVG